MTVGWKGVLETERLLLRRWRDEDRAPFAELNADPEVTRFLLEPLDRLTSDALVDRIEVGFEANGFGLWAVELRSDASFIGFVGLSIPTFEATFLPGVEIGWRLARTAWGHGYATEAASVALLDGFDRIGLDEIISFAAVENVASRRVMERVGLSHVDDFDHPRIPAGHPLRRHVLFSRRRIEQ